MAEIFTNFLSVSTTTGEKIIIPTGVNGNNTNQVQQVSNVMGQQIRDVDSYAQVHSLYISQEDRNSENIKFVDLYIRDISIPGLKVHIGHNIAIVPGSPFYIEKNITLNPNQYLVLNVPTNEGSNNSNVRINVVASSILFT